jgi:transposase
VNGAALGACLLPWISDDRPAAGRSGLLGLRDYGHEEGHGGPRHAGATGDPFNGALYAFRGRRAGLIKLLWHDGIGLCMLTKKLEHGQFIWPSTTTTGRIALTPAQLTALLDGCEWRAPVARRRPELAG